MKTCRKIIALLVLTVLLVGSFSGYAYAAKNDPVKLTVSSTLFVMQGQSSYVDVEAAAAENVRYKLVLECDDKNIAVNGSSPQRNSMPNCAPAALWLSQTTACPAAQMMAAAAIRTVFVSRSWLFTVSSLSLRYAA